MIILLLKTLKIHNLLCKKFQKVLSSPEISKILTLNYFNVYFSNIVETLWGNLQASNLSHLNRIKCFNFEFLFRELIYNPQSDVIINLKKTDM